MRPTQGCNRAVREAEFHIAPLLVRVPKPLQRFPVELPENDSLGREDISSQLNREVVIPCSGSTISNRLIQHVIRSVQLGVFRIALGESLEGFEHGQMVAISCCNRPQVVPRQARASTTTCHTTPRQLSLEA